ncbi:MAG: hypothetical protein A3B44_00890 [Candidatus Levybacteria bacterium RIFCSPLOWO2_01_FULL_38_21]|nr:MAG: hypothetical protein A3B44_00890 [Candidatus Levybacteria bacterium RIFCSPLOWO2_01_FULL_38_21]
MKVSKYDISTVFKNIKNNKYYKLLPDFKEEKTRRLSSIVFSLLALSIFGLFAINPTLSTIARLKKELSDAKFVDQQLTEKIANLSSLQEKYNIIQNDIPIVLAAVPRRPQVPLLIGQLQSIVGKTEIEITRLQSLQVEAANFSKRGKKYSTFSFSISAKGTYENLINFISALSNMQRVISLDTLSINRGSQPGNLQMDIRGTAYFKE